MSKSRKKNRIGDCILCTGQKAYVGLSEVARKRVERMNALLTMAIKPKAARRLGLEPVTQPQSAVYYDLVMWCGFLVSEMQKSAEWRKPALVLVNPITLEVWALPVLPPQNHESLPIPSCL